MATGVRLSGFLLVRYLFPVSFHLSPSLAKGFRVSACLASLPLLVSRLSTASGVRLSRCLSSLVSLHVFPALAIPFGVVLSGSPGVSPYVSSFMRLPLWLVVSGCPAPIIFRLPSVSMSPNSCVFSLQSSVCGTVVVSDSVLVFHNLSPTSLLFPCICLR